MCVNRFVENIFKICRARLAAEKEVPQPPKVEVDALPVYGTRPDDDKNTASRSSYTAFPVGAAQARAKLIPKPPSQSSSSSGTTAAPSTATQAASPNDAKSLLRSYIERKHIIGTGSDEVVAITLHSSGDVFEYEWAIFYNIFDCSSVSQKSYLIRRSQT